MKKIALTILLILTCAFLSSCQLPESLETALTDALALVAEKAEESGAYALTRQFLDGVLAEDAEACLAAMTKRVTLEEMQAALPQIRAMLPEADGYMLTPMHFSFNTSNGVTQTTFQFKLEIGGEYFVVQTQQISTEARLYNINIAPTAADAWNTIDTEPEPFTGWTLLSLLLSVASIGLLVWALVHCIRHTMKRKWLWLLLVLLGNVMPTLTLNDSQLSFRLNLGLYLVASQIAPHAGGFVLNLVLPVGPVIYLMRRKALTAQPKAAFAEAFANSQCAASNPPALEDSHEPEKV